MSGQQGGEIRDERRAYVRAAAAAVLEKEQGDFAEFSGQGQAARNLVSDAMRADSLHYEESESETAEPPHMQMQSTIDIDPVIYLAIDSASTWLVASKLPTSEKTGLHRREAANSRALLALIADLRKKVAVKFGVED